MVFLTAGSEEGNDGEWGTWGNLKPLGGLTYGHRTLSAQKGIETLLLSLRTYLREQIQIWASSSSSVSFYKDDNDDNHNNNAIITIIIIII